MHYLFVITRGEIRLYILLKTKEEVPAGIISHIDNQLRMLADAIEEECSKEEAWSGIEFPDRFYERYHRVIPKEITVISKEGKKKIKIEAIDDLIVMD